MPEEFDAWQELRNLTFASNRGGIVDCHSHLFTERTLTREQYDSLRGMTLEEKWEEADALRRRALRTLDARIRRAIMDRMAQGFHACRSYIDIGPTIGLNALRTVIRYKRVLRKAGFSLQIAVYPVEGVDTKEKRNLLEAACALDEVDVIGCLPSRGRSGISDIATTLGNMEYFFWAADKFGKALDMQIDQTNHPDEMETRWLVGFTEEWRKRGYDRPIAATHCLSMAAWEDYDLILDTLELMARWGVSMVVCPGATFNNKQDREVWVPMHNSIAPWDVALAKGVNVAIGLDNVSDLYMPSSDGDIWKEVKILWDGVRYQRDLSKIADILTINGRTALGL